MKLSVSHDGTCTKGIELEVEEGRIISAEFVGGEPGNPQVVAALSGGMEVGEAIRTLMAIDCNCETSCPGRLAFALEKSVIG